MASPPWEPYPEQRRKLEQRRARRSQRKDSLVSSGAKKSIAVKIALDSLVSPTPSVPKVIDAQDKGKAGDGRGGGYIRHIQDRGDEHSFAPMRPENRRCSREGGCGNEGRCCHVEGSSEGLSCPCNLREICAKSKMVPEVESCGVCMEDGKPRDCCKGYYCKLCYESTGNCPGCQRITVGANLTLLVKVKRLSAKFKGNENEAREEVRDGEECRSCLRQGFFRKCCGEFYCSNCYFKSGHCPSCQVKTERSVKYQRVPPDPGLVPVLVGYVATLLVCLAALTCIALLVASYQSHVETVFRQECYGFFSTCSTEPTCVAYEGNATHGMNPLTKWSTCEDDSTIYKVYGRYCIFDRQVYVLSGGKWGYDFCEDDFVTPTAGVYVFEDTFELWAGSDASSNTMASARWDHVTNGGLSGVCGVDSGDRALVFTGANHREAETFDVDMRYGGKVAFSLKMGPSASDPASVACKPAYGGNVYLYYSLNSGSTWETLTILQTYVYRQEEFMKVLNQVVDTRGMIAECRECQEDTFMCKAAVEVDVPSSLNADVVRFLWRQENFENAFEYWALDDVRVISFFQDDWDQSAAFGASVETEVETLREIRCCFHSEQCDLSNKRQETLDCTKYAAEMSDKRALTGVELFVVLGALVALARSLYRTAEVIVVQGWAFVIPEALRTRPPKIFMADDPVPGAMNKVFGLDVDTRWQRQFLLFVCVPFSICWLYCAALLRNFYLVEEITLLPEVAPTHIKLEAHISGLFLLATFADFNAAFVVAKDVVCVLPVWIPQIDVDLRPAAGWLRVGDKQIMLEDIKDTEMFSRRYCACLAAGYIAGVMPWNLMALIFKYNYPPYGVSRYTTTCFGAVLMMRALLGADWVLKLAYATRWLLTVDMYKRDDIGNAFISGKTKHLVCHCAIWGTLISMGFMCLLNMRRFWIASAAAFGAFAFYGLGLSVVQGLPLTPRILLTTISRGMLIRVHRRVLCPCNWCIDKCGEMHSRDELLCVFVKDSLTFSEMLRGDDTVG